MIDYECTNPQRRRIEKHREQNEEIWCSEEWKEVRDPFIKEHPYCRYCGDPADVPHHPDLSIYGTAEYFDLSDSIPACHICHKGIHRGYFPCQKCRKIRSTSENGTCYSCLDADTKQNIRAGKVRGNEAKNKRDRENYRKYHPRKEVRDGKWVTISPRKTTSTS